ncbi:MAG TPA: hypothetical protein VFM08_14490 [Nocardioides sp.]|jgi:hypothetical protein|nr:hypothetical protein [Nocardioides sp.]
MPDPSLTKAPTKPDHRKDQRALGALEREARSAHGVTALFARRPELRGVLRTADWLEESVRWTA